MRGNDQIDELDPDEGHDDAAEAVDEQVALQDRQRPDWFVSDTAQRQRNQAR